MGKHALQRTAIRGNSSELSSNGPSRQSSAVQRRALFARETEQLVSDRENMTALRKRYETHKNAMSDALVVRVSFNDMLGYLHALNWVDTIEKMSKLDMFFNELADLARSAGTSEKVYSKFIRKLNFYRSAGGSNRFVNMYKEMDKRLLSEERYFATQFTEMDEIYFQKHLANPGPAKTVYRGDGRGVSKESFEKLIFSDIPAGGAPDISFAGVVEHTHTNTLKNGMVSTTTNRDMAVIFATNGREYGVVWKLSLSKYIHVTNLLAARNFKYRFPKQYEILVPGSAPSSTIISATLYKDKTDVEIRYAA